MLTNLLPVMHVTVLSLSMYLMMEHNTAEYARFLKYLRKFRVDYLCFCCCLQMIEEQLALESPISLKVNQESQRSTMEDTDISDDETEYGDDRQ